MSQHAPLEPCGVLLAGKGCPHLLAQLLPSACCKHDIGGLPEDRAFTRAKHPLSAFVPAGGYAVRVNGEPSRLSKLPFLSEV